MEQIVEPVDKKALEAELNRDRFCRSANNGTNEIYVVTHKDSPQVLREIGRLREVTFRAAGGGTGKSIDLDEYDLADDAPYKQLIVWNPEDREIVGGYRYINCCDAPVKNGVVQLATTELFEFSEKFKKEYLPKTIELGRSFVQPKYQPSISNRKGLFSLDNLWDGLGAIVVDNPQMNYFFGKVTMYLDFNKEARDMILYFMNHYFPDKEHLVRPLHPLSLHGDMSAFARQLDGLPYKEGHVVLNKAVRALGENIPPLINSYMNLSSTMRTFGTSLNDHFGEVEETGIMVTISDIYDSKKERHIASYKKGH
jgi:hypothetical protein